MKGQHRRKVEWRTRMEGGPSHAFLHTRSGVESVAVCGLPLPAPWRTNKKAEKCANCSLALRRLW